MERLNANRPGLGTDYTDGGALSFGQPNPGRLELCDVKHAGRIVVGKLHLLPGNVKGH